MRPQQQQAHEMQPQRAVDLVKYMEESLFKSVSTKEMKAQGVIEDQLELLKGVSGALIRGNWGTVRRDLKNNPRLIVVVSTVRDFINSDDYDDDYAICTSRSTFRDYIRDRYVDGSWEVFNMFLRQTPPLNGGKIGFYYKEHEILPPLPVGFHHYILDNFTGDSIDRVIEHEVEEFDLPLEVRAFIEGQLRSMRAHAERLGMPSPPKRIIATGGASANDHILRMIASIFGCNVYTLKNKVLCSPASLRC